MRLIFKENMRLRKVVALKNNNGHSIDEIAKLQFVKWRDGERMVKPNEQFTHTRCRAVRLDGQRNSRKHELLR